MTKKILAIILAALMVATMVACNNGKPEDTTTEGKINITTESSTDDSTESGETGAPVDTTEGKTPGEYDYTESTGTVYILHKNGAVNLRNADGTKFESFKNGTSFQKIAVSTDGTITKVVYEGKEYFVYSSGVTTIADPDEGFVEVSKTLVLETESLKIRIVPDFESLQEPIGFYNKGDQVKVIAVNTTNPEEPWYKVEFVNYDGQVTYGYVSAAAKHYVQDETTEATGTTTTETTGATTTESTTESDTEAAE